MLSRAPRYNGDDDNIKNSHDIQCCPISIHATPNLVHIILHKSLGYSTSSKAQDVQVPFVKLWSAKYKMSAHSHELYTYISYEVDLKASNKKKKVDEKFVLSL
jgi:hypothetical protein